MLKEFQEHNQYKLIRRTATIHLSPQRTAELLFDKLAPSHLNKDHIDYKIVNVLMTQDDEDYLMLQFELETESK